MHLSHQKKNAIELLQEHEKTIRVLQLTETDKGQGTYKDVSTHLAEVFVEQLLEEGYEPSFIRTFRITENHPHMAAIQERYEERRVA